MSVDLICHIDQTEQTLDSIAAGEEPITAQNWPDSGFYYVAQIYVETDSKKVPVLIYTARDNETFDDPRLNRDGVTVVGKGELVIEKDSKGSKGHFYRHLTKFGEGVEINEPHFRDLKARSKNLELHKYRSSK